MTSEQRGVDGGPAFPSPSFAVPRSLDAEHVVKLRDMQGMTLRDYFAAKAMAAIIVANNANQTVIGNLGAATDAYTVADAMLAARGAP